MIILCQDAQLAPYRSIVHPSNSSTALYRQQHRQNVMVPRDCPRSGRVKETITCPNPSGLMRSRSMSQAAEVQCLVVGVLSSLQHTLAFSCLEAPTSSSCASKLSRTKETSMIWYAESYVLSAELIGKKQIQPL